MTLILVQHGDAKDKSEDPDRPLNEAGEREADALGQFLARAGLRADTVVHSTKTRARQTAERVAEKMGANDGPKGMDGLAAKDPVEPFAKHAGSFSGVTVVCGHMPFLGKLASLLVTGREDGASFAFEPGSAVALEQEGDGWSVRFMVRPELLS
jgi:phosphohistidine phosphatase